MSYVSMRKMLEQAREGKYAVGAFNIFNYQSARAAISAAEELRSPLILQTSVKTALYFGPSELARLLIPLAERANVPVCIHLDHCKDVVVAKECMDAGWSSIMYDGSSFSLEENIARTRQVMDYVQGRDISVEGELGAIVGVEEEIVVSDDDGSLADLAMSVRYTAETGVDVFAPAIGTAHGVYKGEPKLNFQRFVEIGQAVPQPLVVHGGTGLADDVFRRLISLGATKINVSTALKLSYQKALAQAAQFTEPLKADACIEKVLQEEISGFIRVFGSENKALTD